MLLSAECCGVAVFANAINTTCKQCEKKVDLRINPSIVGVQSLTAFRLSSSPLAILLPQSLHCSYGPGLNLHAQLGPILDETGQIGSGKLILSDRAWGELLGRTTSQLVDTDVEVLRYLEQRLLFLRVTMGFALKLEDEVGRLAVWCVKS
jgi:hypothetical protein